MGSKSKFWDRIAKRYAKQPINDEASYQRKLLKTREYLNSTTTLLEFGCGTGSTALAHAPYVSHVHAIDFSAKMLEIAEQKKNELAVENVTFKKNNLLEYQGGTERWDAVMAMSMLHLVENKELALKKIFELLKPGGVFITSTPCIADNRLWIRCLLPIFRWLPVLPTIYLFSQQEFVEMLSRCGFDIEYVWRPEVSKASFVIARKP